MTDSSRPDSETSEIQPPPTTLGGVMRHLGPGLIIAGSIVGSGELIATTKTGAQAGIELLWLIVLGCLIKVFVQIELGRFSISHGETTLSALNRVPGPVIEVSSDAERRHKARGNWIVWLWFGMTLTTVGQLGGIVGGVGQAFAVTVPITGDYREAIRTPSQREFENYIKWRDDLASGGTEFDQLPEQHQRRIENGQADLAQKIEAIGDKGEQILGRIENGEEVGDLIDPTTIDDKLWAAVVAVFTAVILFFGRYSLIQNVSMALVVAFTFITIGNVVSLQGTKYALSADDVIRGLSFGAPVAVGDMKPWITALATFGIIGVGATELIAYPYWCLEKGYARFAGPRDDTDGWVKRARGWMRVMHYDAFASMIVYTTATIAFYLMGVSVLFNEGRDPDGMRMVSTLAEAYIPVFGDYAKWLFLVGAIAVLYSTFMVANASNARTISDCFRVIGMTRSDESRYRQVVSILSVVLPLLCLTVFCTGYNPVTLILIAGATQACMLPIVGFSAVYFRYRLTDQRLHPPRWWDVMLVVSCIGLLMAGGYGIWKIFGA